jgi:putative FmdB family regulatory protein
VTLYEYRCMACRALFTERRAMESRNDPAICPQCGKEARRALSAPTVCGGAWGRPANPETLRATEEIWR